MYIACILRSFRGLDSGAANQFYSIALSLSLNDFSSSIFLSFFSPFFLLSFAALQFTEFLGFITVYRPTGRSLVILIETPRETFLSLFYSA